MNRKKKKHKKNPHAVALGRKGGLALAAKMTDKEREESARRAAEAKWAKEKPPLNDSD